MPAKHKTCRGKFLAGRDRASEEESIATSQGRCVIASEAVSLVDQLEQAGVISCESSGRSLGPFMKQLRERACHIAALRVVLDPEYLKNQSFIVTLLCVLGWTTAPLACYTDARTASHISACRYTQQCTATCGAVNARPRPRMCASVNSLSILLHLILRDMKICASLFALLILLFCCASARADRTFFSFSWLFVPFSSFVRTLFLKKPFVRV